MRLKSKLVVANFVWLCMSTLIAAQVVQTAQGKIEGQKDSSGYSFKGIPYAAPPVGELRWRAPQPVASWLGIRKANQFAASCMQAKAPAGFEMLPWTKEFLIQNDVSEDCLYLNVWTPRLGDKAKLPVIVFIHGGAFINGSGEVEVYHGDHLAAKGVIVVTINYRLSVLGFLAHPELSAESGHHVSGNYGLLDQIAALQWVKANITQFGGDPHNVTIWGQSAGAASVGNLVASPLAAGLFQRAQADSGLGAHGFATAALHDAETRGVSFAAAHHVASLKELRALPADAFLSGGMPMMFSPIVDGWVLPDTPTNMNAKGTDNDVPLITGYQSGDSAMFTPHFDSLNAYRKMIRTAYGEMAPEYEKLYPASDLKEAGAMWALSGQERSRVSMFLFARARAKAHRQPVYTYYFDRAIPWPEHPGFGAFHSGELPYFFLNLQMLQRPWEKADEETAHAVSSYLVDFATKGDPNGNGLVRWPKIDPDVPQTMELGSRCGSMPLANPAKINFWTRYYATPISNNGSPF